MKKSKTKLCMGDCGKRVPLRLFNAAQDSPDGLQPMCIICHAKYGRFWRLDNGTHHRKYSRRYYATNRKKILARRRRYVKAHPGIIRAQQLVRDAIRQGKIKRQPCEVCGKNRRVETHHEDYRKAYVIQWYCKMHHLRRHAQKRFAKRRVYINARLKRLARKAA